MHSKNIVQAGNELNKESKVLIMVHGRGGTAQDIISISSYLNVKDFTILAPQAVGNTWYPSSFMAPVIENEPWLSSALNLLKELTDDLNQQGIPSGNIYFLGFSQGACLTLEFMARNARRYGGVVAFTGGLIGDGINAENYVGDFKNCPVFIGTSDPDPHVPVERVAETTRIFKTMNADVVEKVYNGMGHTISLDEIEMANQHVFGIKNK